LLAAAGGLLATAADWTAAAGGLLAAAGGLLAAAGGLLAAAGSLLIAADGWTAATGGLLIATDAWIAAAGGLLFAGGGLEILDLSIESIAAIRSARLPSASAGPGGFDGETRGLELAGGSSAGMCAGCFVNRADGLERAASAGAGRTVYTAMVCGSTARQPSSRSSMEKPRKFVSSPLRRRASSSAGCQCAASTTHRSGAPSPKLEVTSTYQRIRNVPLYRPPESPP
jgi:hypothetical protein